MECYFIFVATHEHTIRADVGKETNLYPWGRWVISYACYSVEQVTTFARYSLAPLSELRYGSCYIASNVTMLGFARNRILTI